MTDKQIIIDGVDVSGCENALQGKHTMLCAGNEDRALCDANKNCLYKKYKRKEQECEKLKEAIDGLLKIQYQLADSCTKYEQALTEIKGIAEPWYTLGSKDSPVAQILRKISECEGNNDMENN